MYLKLLGIRGFKSFAEKTVLHFEPGISVIIGPNGSGKSNLVDAILWALGEQSPRSLRGESMEDIIFSGSPHRPPLGMAEATLVFDNSDGFLPLDYTEVSVTRRLFRSGESQYLLNGEVCRLLDIEELLSDACLGQRLHTVVTQGELEELINGRPEERRTLIEEVAGVHKHRKRKGRVIRRMENLKETLNEIRGFLSDLEARIRPVKRQVKMAKEYKELSEELRELSLNLIAFELKKAKRRWQSIEEEEERLKEKEKVLVENLEKVREEIIHCREEMGSRGIAATDVGEIKESFQKVGEKISGSLRVLEEKGRNLVEKLSEIRRKIYRLERQRKEKKERISEFEGERKALEAQLTDLHHSLKDARLKSEKAKKERLRQAEELRKKEEALSRAEKERGRIERRNFEMKEELGEAKSNHFLLQRELERLGKRLKEIKSSQAKLLEEEEEEKRIFKECSNSFKQMEKEFEKAKTDFDDLESRIEALNQEISNSLSQKAFLESLLSSYPFSNEVTLKDEIEVKKGYEKAVEAFLGNHLFSFLQEKEADISKIKSDEEGKSFFCSFLVQKKREVTPDKPTLSQFVKTEREEIRALFSKVFLVGGLKEAVRYAREWPNFSFVTKEGALVKGCFIDFPSKENVLVRRTEFREVKEKIEKLDKDYSELLRRKKSFQNWLNRLRRKIGEVKGLQEEKKSTISYLEEKKKRLSEEEREVEEKRAEAEKKIESISQRIENLSNEMKRIDEMEGKILKEINRLSEEVVKARKEYRRCEEQERNNAEEVGILQLRITSLIEKNNLLRREEQILRSEAEEIEKQLEVESKVAEALEELKDRIEPLHNIYVMVLSAIEERMNFLDELRATEKTAFSALRKKLEDAQEEEIKLQSEMDELKENLPRLNEERGKLKERVSNLSREAFEEWRVPLETLVRNYPNREFVKAELFKEIEKIKKRLSRLGGINLLAEKEYTELMRQKEEIEKQLHDILKTRQLVEGVMISVDKKIKEKFLETFEKTNKNFKEIFSELFPQGKAELVLSGKNPLESGVEIVAQPQGKSLRRLSLLSGGERALVALSLLFSFHRTLPSPLYVFDEVEPALDSSNLERFMKFLKMMRNEAQVIIITHQRSTMEVGDVLYGVTIGSDGVSRVYNQRMREEVKGA